MAQIRATVSAVVTLPDSLPVAVIEGQAYDTDDEIVRQRPDLFESPIEEATSNPGQRRNTRR